MPADLRDHYDVALSFAGEQRKFVKTVAGYLQERGFFVFYDEIEQIALWGKDLILALEDAYCNRSEYCVIFASKAYADKQWTRHELRSALARAITEKREYILVARFDDTKLPGIPHTMSYLDLNRLSPEQLAEGIVEKLGPSKSASGSPGSRSEPKPVYRMPRTPATSFNPYEECQNFIQQLVGTLAERGKPLIAIGVSISRFSKEGQECIRFVANGKALYSLNAWMGGLGRDAGLSIYRERGEIWPSGSSMNAWGHFQPDPNTGEPRIDIQGLERFSGRNLYTPTQVIEGFWDEVCDAIETDRRRSP